MSFDTTVGCLYLIGGLKIGTDLTDDMQHFRNYSWLNPSYDVVRMDVLQHTIDVIFMLQRPRNAGKAVVHDNCLFVLGGEYQSGARSDQVDIIDLKTMQNVVNHKHRQRFELLQQLTYIEAPLFIAYQSLCAMTITGTLHCVPWMNDGQASSWQLRVLHHPYVRFLSCVGNTLLYQHFGGSDPPVLGVFQLN